MASITGIKHSYECGAFAILIQPYYKVFNSDPGGQRTPKVYHPFDRYHCRNSRKILFTFAKNIELYYVIV